MEPQLVPIAPVRNAEVLSIRFASVFSSPAGEARYFLYLEREKRA